ncbi:MAG: hypothetical protein U0L59_07980 [Faecalimonas sp.]|nr:hypothetical protein [Faecalimonas sp.]
MGIAIKNAESYAVDCAMRTVLAKLDKAIEDLENGRVLSAEEVWKELDSI